MENIVAKTLPLDNIRPESRISLFFTKSELYTLYDIRIPAAHANNRINERKVPKYCKFSQCVKFHAIKLIILMLKTIRVPVTTLLLFPSR
jgi:hypothetical protein